jgi:hypothetical protein
MRTDTRQTRKSRIQKSAITKAENAVDWSRPLVSLLRRKPLAVRLVAALAACARRVKLVLVEGAIIVLVYSVTRPKLLLLLLLLLLFFDVVVVVAASVEKDKSSTTLCDSSVLLWNCSHKNFLVCLLSQAHKNVKFFVQIGCIIRLLVRGRKSYKDMIQRNSS